MACAACYGEPDSPATRGLTWAIVVLGLVVVGVMGGAVAFFVQSNRKAALLATGKPSVSAEDRSGSPAAGSAVYSRSPQLGFAALPGTHESTFV
jgi:hypothetical protein